MRAPHRPHRPSRLGRLRAGRRCLHRLRPRRAPGRRACPVWATSHAEWLFVGEAPGARRGCARRAVRRAGGQAPRQHARGARAASAARTSTSPTCSSAGRRTTARRSRAKSTPCRPYLDRQIALIRPKVIVALGKSAATTLLDVDATIASLRGRVHRYAGVPLVVTYHPAYLLRNLPDKQKAWEDLLFARRTLRDGAATRPPKRLTGCLAKSLPLAWRSPAQPSRRSRPSSLRVACVGPLPTPTFVPCVVPATRHSSGGTMIRKIAGLLAALRHARARGLRLQRPAAAG